MSTLLLSTLLLLLSLGPLPSLAHPTVATLEFESCSYKSGSRSTPSMCVTLPVPKAMKCPHSTAQSGTITFKARGTEEVLATAKLPNPDVYKSQAQTIPSELDMFKGGNRICKFYFLRIDGHQWVDGRTKELKKTPCLTKEGKKAICVNVYQWNNDNTMNQEAEGTKVKFFELSDVDKNAKKKGQEVGWVDLGMVPPPRRSAGNTRAPCTGKRDDGHMWRHATCWTYMYVES